MQILRIYTVILISITLLTILGFSLASPQLMKKVTISSGGKILTKIFFDDCNQVDNWRASSTVSLTLDFIDKVEGTASLKGIYPSGVYGGMFYKEGGWNLTDTPLMRMWVKVNASIPGLLFEIITGEKGNPAAWNGFRFEILNRLTIGEWSEIVFDLRQPNYTDPEGKLPCLAYTKHIEFFTWNMINVPASINWDNITVSSGPYITPRCAVSPSSTSAVIGENVTFSIYVLGGEPPYSYSWRVNATPKGTSETFVYTPTEAGYYVVNCTVTDNRGNLCSGTAELTILSSPPPQPSIPSSIEIFKSEVRAVSIAYVWSSRDNHTLIAETLFNYGINTAYVDIDKAYFYGYDEEWNENEPFRDLTYHRVFIEECHKRGIRVIASLIVMSGAPSQMRTQKSGGVTVNWLDITRDDARNMLRLMVETLARDYDFDGINFDYIRWDTEDMPLTESARLKFIADTGKTDVNWPTDVLSDGRYYWDFLNWRANLVTELVGDMYRWAKAVNPNIIVAITPFTGLPDAGWYWVKTIGQHAADMVDKGYADFISPMIYDADPSVSVGRLQASIEFFTGCVEGKIPMIPWINHLIGTPQDLVQKLTAMKNVGMDGWILNPYGGPGAPSVSYNDIRPYLAALYDAGLMKPIWAIQNFNVEINGNYTTISWTTTVPTNTTIEYADGKIFYTITLLYQNNLLYENLEYNGSDSTKIYNPTWSTAHSFTIPITENTRFRIWCIDEKSSFTLTSREFTILEFKK